MNENELAFFMEMFKENQIIQNKGEKAVFIDEVSIIKKAIIYLIMVLDNLKLFLMLKSKQVFKYESYINKKISQKNKGIIKNALENDTKDYSFGMDKGLYKKSIFELIDLITIDDLMLYLRVTQINILDKKIIKEKKRIPVKNGTRSTTILIKYSKTNNDCRSDSNKQKNLEFNLDPVDRTTEQIDTENDQKNWVEIKISEFELNDILLAKRKRTDEKLKHSFKSIRRKIIPFFFKKKDRTRSNRIFKRNFENEKNKFFTYFFKSNKRLREMYKNERVTKKLVTSVKKCKKLLDFVKEYNMSEFLKNEIDMNILKKQEDFISDKMNLKDFLNLLMTKQKKTGWNIQNILNSLEEFDHCSIDTILK